MDYRNIGALLPIDRGVMHADPNTVQKYGVSQAASDRQEIVNNFNKIAQAENLPPLRDPLGYMELPSNAYRYTNAKFNDVYTRQRSQIEMGVRQGGTYATEAVMGKLASVVRKTVSEYLPEGIKYSDLKFTPLNEDLRNAIDHLAEKRSELTFMYVNKRSFEPARQKQLRQEFQKSGQRFGECVARTWHGQVKNQTLSLNTLLANSHDNKTGLARFKKELTSPSVGKDENGEIKASYTSDNLEEAKFLLANRTYLQDYGFDIKKANGRVSVSWTSDKVEQLYKQEQANTLSLDGLDKATNNLLK